MRARAPSLVLAVLFASGCAGGGYRALTVPAPPPLASADPDPVAQGLVDQFYSTGLARDGRAALATALATRPGDGALHEVAGYLALLDADPDAAFDHFMRAAADPRAVAPELALWEMASVEHTATQHLRAQAFYRELAAHPRPAVRALAAHDLARGRRLYGDLDEATALTAGLGFAGSWRVLGAFDNDQGKGFDTAYPCEPAADGGAPGVAAEPAEYAGVRLPIRWRQAEAQPLHGLLTLHDRVAPFDWAMAYAQTSVVSPDAREAELRLTADSALKVWLNGRLVASDDTLRREAFDNLVVRVALRAGSNRILVKTAHRTGPWQLGLRVTRAGGEPAADLRFDPSAAAPAPPAGPEAPPLALVVPADARLAALGDPRRKRFLSARLAEATGRPHVEPTILAKLLAEVPGNPLAVYFTALAAWDSGETGKAVDLLDRGVATFHLPGFLVKRARFYGQKKLPGKAAADLREALRLQPAAREAYFETASLDAGRGWAIDRCQVFEQALGQWPDSAVLLTDEARCSEERGYFDRAEQGARRAVALVPGYLPALRLLAATTERRLDFGEARRWVGRLRAQSPGSVDDLLTEAELYRRAGEPAFAERLLEAASALDPDLAQPYLREAELAWEARRKPDAERLYRLALERDPDNSALSERVDLLFPGQVGVADGLVPGADELDRVVREARQVVVHPGSHSVVLLADEVVAVGADGSSKRVVTRIEQAANTEGRDALIQSKLPAGGRVKVLQAYSVGKGGEAQEASSVTDAMIRYRALDVGSIVVEQYVQWVPRGAYAINEFAGQRAFEAVGRQLEQVRWRVVLDRDRPLQVKTRGAVKRTTEVVSGKQVHSFSAEHVPPALSEPFTPWPDVLAMVAVSTHATWDTYAQWELALLKDAFVSSPALDALARKLTLGAATPKAKLDQLWSYVAAQIRYQQEYEETIAGVKPHAAAQVLERGYGDCKDKAVLLIRLARSVGIDLRFALLRTTPGGELLRDIPFQQFNHAIAYVPAQAGFAEGLFIDTTTNGLDIGNLRTDDQGATSLVLDPQTGKHEFLEIPYQTAELESVKQTIAVTVTAPDRARATERVESRGGVAQRLRVVLRNPENARTEYQAMSEQLFAGTTLLAGTTEHDQDLFQPLAIELAIDASNAVQPHEDGLRLAVPTVFPLGRYVTLAARKQPLAMARAAQAMTLVVDLPEGYQATHLPAPVSVEHRCFSFKRTAVAAGQRVTLGSTYRNACARLAPEEYPAFRAAVQRVLAASQDPLLFGRKSGARAAPKPGAGAKGPLAETKGEGR